MKQIAWLFLLALALALAVTVTTDAFDSPVSPGYQHDNSPLPTPPWLPTAVAIATARAQATLDAGGTIPPTPTAVPCPRPGMWETDPWMGVYPLWTDGTNYCVAMP